MSIYEANITNPKSQLEFYKDLSEQQVIMIDNLKNKINHLENNYYHALAIIFNDEKLINRKKQCLKEDYEEMKVIRSCKIMRELNR